MALAGLVLAFFHLVGFIFLDGFALDLGSFDYPTPKYLKFVGLWVVFGTVAAGSLALAIAHYWSSSRTCKGLDAAWRAVTDNIFLTCACVAAFVIPLSIRYFVLGSAPLTDDESAYRFAAELIASGRLWVVSPQPKIFFDQNFMINDGRLYPMYFLGWPAFLQLGLWVGAPGLVNPLLSALTVPPLALALRRFVGRRWARAGVLLFLSAPFIQIAAATLLSHTACLMALTWALYF